MSQLRTLWSRLGRPEAISWFNFGYVVALQTPGSVLSALVDIEGRVVEFLSLRLLALGVLGLVLGLGRIVLNRIALDKSRPWVTLTTFAAAVTVGTAVFDSLLVATQFEDEYRFAGRLLIAFTGTVTGMIMVSLIVTSALEQSLTNLRLGATIDELTSLRAKAEDTIALHEKELIQEIRSQVEVRLSGLAGQNAADISKIKGLIDDVVRPLSYSLARSDTSLPETRLPDFSPRVSWRQVIEWSFRSTPFPLLALPIVVGAISSFFLISSFGPRGLLAATLIMATSFAMMAAGKALFALIPTWSPLALRIAIHTVVTSALALSTAGVITTVTGFDVWEPLRFAAWFTIIALASWAVTLVFGVYSLLSATNIALRDSVDSLRREVASINISLRQLNKSISRILHGPIQSAITAVVMKLEAHPGLADDPGFVAGTRKKIAEAMELLATPTSFHSNPFAIVSDLQELWGDEVDISLSISEPSRRHIERSQATSYALTEVLRETCHNAITHGRATSIIVSIQVRPREHKVQIEVENTGIPLSGHSQAGLGSQLLSDLSLSWTRRGTASGTKVSITLPLLGTQANQPSA
jgi:uncharacterized membrane protein (DUF2068 family)